MNTTMSHKLVDLLPLSEDKDNPGKARLELELLESALDYVPDLVYIQDNNSTVRLANLAFCQKTGLRRDQIIGKDSFDLFPPEVAQTLESKVKALSVSPDYLREEELIIDEAGKTCTLDSIKIPLFDSGNRFQGIFSICRDITQEKRRDQERESLINSLKDTLNMLEKQSKVLKEMNTQLKDLATTDDLTQVSNRRYFDHHFEIEWRRCRRDRAPLALMMIDIDHFKLFNDHYGHTKGDVCLSAVAKVLNEQLCRRPGDVFARFGGEEFVALLPNTVDGVEKIADRCNKVVAELGIEHVKSSVEGSVVTASIGAVVGYPHLLDDSLDLLDLADQQLYLAKQSGRNTYVYFGPEEDPDSDGDSD